PAGDDEILVAEGHRLRAEDDRLEARAADLADRRRRDRVRDLGEDRGLAGRGLADACREDVAEEDLADLIGRELAALEGALDGDGAEARRSERRERAEERADRGTRGGDDVDGGQGHDDRLPRAGRGRQLTSFLGLKVRSGRPFTPAWHSGTSSSPRPRSL